MSATFSGSASDPREQATVQDWDARWASVGNPPRPKVSRLGTPDDVAAAEWAAFVGRSSRAVARAEDGDR